MITLSTLPSEQKAAWLKFIGKINPTGNKNDRSQFVIDSQVATTTKGVWQKTMGFNEDAFKVLIKYNNEHNENEPDINLDEFPVNFNVLKDLVKTDGDWNYNHSGVSMLDLQAACLELGETNSSTSNSANVFSFGAKASLSVAKAIGVQDTTNGYDIKYKPTASELLFNKKPFDNLTPTQQKLADIHTKMNKHLSSMGVGEYVYYNGIYSLKLDPRADGIKPLYAKLSQLCGLINNGSEAAVKTTDITDCEKLYNEAIQHITTGGEAVKTVGDAAIMFVPGLNVEALGLKILGEGAGCYLLRNFVDGVAQTAITEAWNIVNDDVSKRTFQNLASRLINNGVSSTVGINSDLLKKVPVINCANGVLDKIPEFSKKIGNPLLRKIYVVAADQSVSAVNDATGNYALTPLKIPLGALTERIGKYGVKGVFGTEKPPILYTMVEGVLTQLNFDHSNIANLSLNNTTEKVESTAVKPLVRADIKIGQPSTLQTTLKKLDRL